jgi:hypothetical protein
MALLACQPWHYDGGSQQENNSYETRLGFVISQQSHSRENNHVSCQDEEQASSDLGSSPFSALLSRLGAEPPEYDARRQQFDCTVATERK